MFVENEEFIVEQLYEQQAMLKRMKEKEHKILFKFQIDIEDKEIDVAVHEGEEAAQIAKQIIESHALSTEYYDSIR